MSFFDNETIEIPCPGCGQKHEKSIGWVKANNEIPCGCGATIKLEKDEFVRKMNEAERLLDNFPRKITINL